MSRFFQRFERQRISTAKEPEEDSRALWRSPRAEVLRSTSVLSCNFSQPHVCRRSLDISCDNLVNIDVISTFLIIFLYISYICLTFRLIVLYSVWANSFLFAVLDFLGGFDCSWVTWPTKPGAQCQPFSDLNKKAGLPNDLLGKRLPSGSSYHWQRT